MSASDLTLVIGGTGVLGFLVVEKLVAQGRRVRVVARRPDRSRRLESLGVELVLGDMTRPESMRDAYRGVGYVVAAAHSLLGRGRYSSERVDGVAHERLFDTVATLGVERLVYVSVHGAHEHHPVPFWRIKARTEAYLGRTSLAHTILRPTAFMDFHADVLVGEKVRRARAVPLVGPGTNPRNFVAADDVARMVLVGLQSTAAAERIEVGGPGNPSTLDVVACYEGIVGRPVKRRHLPLAVANPLQRVVGLLHAGAGQALLSAIVSETTDQTWHGAGQLTRYGVTPIGLEEWVLRRMRRLEGASPAG